QIIALAVEPGANNSWGSTLLGQLCRYYNNWSGSLEITFMFCGSFMATGKVLIAYTPPGGSSPTSRKDAMLGTHVIWDFGLQSSVTLCIPWISNTCMRNCASLAYQSYFAGGYVTMWYQTNFVVPEGAPTSGRIIALAAAQSNFVLRLMKDSNVISQSAILQSPIEQALENAVTKLVGTAADTVSSKQIVGEVTPALQAAETGATSNTNDSGLIETRSVINNNSIAETDVESFYSRAGLAGMVSLIRTGSNANTFTSWVIDTMGMTQIRRKWEMFTYMRMDLEFTLVITQESNTDLPTAMVQYMYIPPGSEVPTSQDSYLWQTGTNPSIFVKTTDPPAQFSVPFMSTCAAYAWFFDGYPRNINTNPAGQAEAVNKSYGILPANMFGTLGFRLVGSTTNVNLIIRIYVKPKHVKCWVPRPFRMLNYVEKNTPAYRVPSSVFPVANRASITTAGAFGQQSGAVYVGNYRIVNKHLANEFDAQSVVWESYERDLLVSTTTAHGCDKIARCNCNTGVYFCRSQGKHYPVCFQGPGLTYIEANQYYPARYQSHVLLANGPAQPGD
ncbi:polyprotein, partial [Enterovirus J121]